jgi:hypothetical protein
MRLNARKDIETEFFSLFFYDKIIDMNDVKGFGSFLHFNLRHCPYLSYDFSYLNLILDP